MFIDIQEGVTFPTSSIKQVDTFYAIYFHIRTHVLVEIYVKRMIFGVHVGLTFFRELPFKVVPL